MTIQRCKGSINITHRSSMKPSIALESFKLRYPLLLLQARKVSLKSPNTGTSKEDFKIVSSSHRVLFSVTVFAA
jgi:hypothetical protein